MKLKNKKYFFFMLGMAAVDFILFEASFLAVYFLRNNQLTLIKFLNALPSFFSPYVLRTQYYFEVYLRLSLLFSGILLITFYYFGLYRMKRGGDELDEIFNIFKAVILAVLILIGFTFLVQEISYSRFVIYTAGPVAFLGTGFWRTILWLFIGWLHKKGHGINHILIYGAGQAGKMVLEEIKEHGEFGYKVFGFVDDDPVKVGQKIDGIKVLGTGKEILEIAKRARIDEIIVAFPSADRKKISELIFQFQNTGINLKIMPDLFDIITSRVATEKVGNIPLLEVLEDPLAGWPALFKRGLDIFGSTFGLIILTPLFLIIAAIIKLTSQGPIFFTQTRLGKKSQPFFVYKFRTMKIGAEKEKEKLLELNEAQGPIFKIKDDPRFTPIGRFLRRTSIDELPQLANVFLGQMSLVGPRPPLPHEVEKYEPWQKKRLNTTPGITGLWQIRGRSLLPFEQMAKLDIYYIENWSLWLDIKILLKTVWAVASGRGAY